MLEMTERVGQRMHFITGRTTEIQRETEDGPVMSAGLDYEMNNLLAAGIRVNSAPNIDLEIDDLIRFCVSHALGSNM